MDYILGLKLSLNSFYKIHIIQIVFSNHYGMKSEIGNRSKMGKFTNSWIENMALSHNQLIKEEIARKLRKEFYTNKNENPTYQMYGTQQKHR